MVISSRSARKVLCALVDERARLDCACLVPYVKDDADWLSLLSHWAQLGYAIAGDDLTGDRCARSFC